MFDYTDRLPYWIQRVAKGGKVLVPGRKDRPVQIVDIKDVANWDSTWQKTIKQVYSM